MQSAICTNLISILNASHAKSDIIIIIWIKDKFGFKICGNCVYKQRLFREGWFFFFNWTFNNALVPRRVNIHLEFWHLVYTNSCSDGRTGISNGSMIPKLVDFWVCFYCEFDPIFFINSKLSADFLIYVFLITSTSCCNFQTLCSMSTMTSAPSPTGLML